MGNPCTFLEILGETKTALEKLSLEKNRKRQKKVCLDGIIEFS